jgi:hypothetical protein
VVTNGVIDKIEIGEDVGWLETGIAYGSQMRSITLPRSMTGFNVYAMYVIPGLRHLTVPSGMTSMRGTGLLGYCPQVKSVSLSIATWATQIINNAFVNSQLRRLVLPPGTTTIGANVMSGCSILEQLIVPEGVTTISSGAMEGCPMLKELTLPSTTTNIATAFVRDFKLHTLTVKAVTPPTLRSGTFTVTTLIYVPAEALEDYKAATNWSAYADRIYPITD